MKITHVDWHVDRTRGPSAADWPFLTVIAAWINARQTRRRLLRCQVLDRRFAVDIGRSPDEMAFECNRPFWRIDT
jgi:uncharacterized protein YjiS (DUF1127 family)